MWSFVGLAEATTDAGGQILMRGLFHDDVTGSDEAEFLQFEPGFSLLALQEAIDAVVLRRNTPEAPIEQPV